jgi:hypothetical protein
MGLLLIAVFSLAATGRIRVAGILQNKATGAFDPARAQLLIQTLLFAGLMLTQLDHMREVGKVVLPSNGLLYLFGGGQGLYLVRKYLQVRSQTKGG